MSEPINDGGNAFPEHHYFDESRGAYGEHMTASDVGCGGMTLRDYFAAKAMVALLPMPKDASYGVDHPYSNLNVSIAAYAIADAMLEARSAK